jgi:toxin CcdB
MARFSVHRHRDGTLMVNCQSDLLDGFSTRIVVPLVLKSAEPPRFKRLHPLVEVDGKEYTLATHLLTSVTINALGSPVADLAHEQSTIMNAIDMLTSGF